MFNMLCSALYEKPFTTRNTSDGSPVVIWSDSEKILCEDKLVIDLIADMLDAQAGYGIACTGWYDREEDEACGTVDEYTGNYYVTIDD